MMQRRVVSSGSAIRQERDLKLSFHGADRSVTGSCHLVECAGKRILIDCGLHQGSRELDEENAGPFGFDAAGINYVLLTHAHLDHCGRLPLLAKRGFRGEIITTSASRELARLIMLDSFSWSLRNRVIGQACCFRATWAAPVASCCAAPRSRHTPKTS